jgi:iron complex transport system permease protein
VSVLTFDLDGRHVVARTTRMAARVDVRATVAALVLAAAATVLACWHLSVGDFSVPISDVVAALAGGASEDAEFIVRQLRLPRTLTGALVGAALALSGAVFQSLARNPLASPDIIGVTAGASAAAVTVIVLAGGGNVVDALSGLGVPGAALAGGLGAAAIVYLLAWRNGMTGYRLVLMGIAVTAVLTSVTSYLLTRADVYEATRATVWMTGSLNGRSWAHVWPVLAGVVVLAPIVLSLTSQLRILQMGDDTARALGMRVERARVVLIVAAVGLAALATAAAGPVAFIGFVAPVLARRVVGGGTPVLVVSMLMGTVLVLASDLVARRLFAPTELPVGIITALVGGPYLLWSLWRANSIGAAG